MKLTRQQCPACTGDCNLAIDFADGNYAVLDDRLLGLTDLAVEVKCLSCGQLRTGWIRDLDYSWSTRAIEHGEIIYD